MADGDETLELNEEGYPRLPDDVLTLRLSRKKSILRQFMSMVRRMCCSISTNSFVTDRA